MTKDIDPRLAKIAAEYEEKMRNRPPLAERLATPEGKALVAELDRAVEVATKLITQNEEVVGLLIAQQKGTDHQFFIPLIFKDPQEQQSIYSTIRALLVAYDIQSYVTLSEGWACMQEHYDPDIRNADNPHRIEVLMVLAVNADLSIFKRLEIYVDEDGDRGVRPLGPLFKGEIVPEDGIMEAEGQLASFLPPKGLTISDDARAALRAMLPFQARPVREVFGH